MAGEKGSVFCTNCGAKNDSKAKFCIKCGQSLVKIDTDEINNEAEAEKHGSIMDSATSQLNSWTGGTGAVKISWKEFFGQVLKSHTEGEAEDIFIAGTKKTTPSLEEISDEKVQPWLFSRILVTIVLAGVLLSVLTNLNQQVGDLLAMDVVLAISVPMAALVLFFEINVYRNISFYRIGKIMLLGGILSLILTIVVSNIVSNGASFDFVGALLIGIIEETSKLVIAAYFVNKLKIKRIFNGLLIGAAVGTGFSAFENIQYMVGNGQYSGISVALQRAAFSISDHTEWCAIATAGLVIVKGAQSMTASTFTNVRFLKFLGLVIILHMLWDWNMFDNSKYIICGIVAVITWVTVFVLIQAGLREVKELQLSKKLGGKEKNHEN